MQYAADADVTTNGTKEASHKLLLSVRKDQRSSKQVYESQVNFAQSSAQGRTLTDQHEAHPTGAPTDPRLKQIMAALKPEGSRVMPPLSFQDHLDSTRLLFDNLATYVKTHGLDTTAKLLEHFKANQQMRGGRGGGRNGKDTGPKFRPGKGTPGRKLQVADKNTVCDACDAFGHFARDCTHRKPNAIAAQKKRDAAYADRTVLQTRELKEIKKLTKENEKLRALATAANNAVSEDDWESDDETEGGAARGAVKQNHYLLSSPPSSLSAPKSYLLSVTAPNLSDISHPTSAVLYKQVHFPPVLSTAPRLGKHRNCSFLSCSCSKCMSFKNSNGFWLLYSLDTVLCQKRIGCKCRKCRKFYTSPGDRWNEAASQPIPQLSVPILSLPTAPILVSPTVTPIAENTLHRSTDIHLISASATFLKTPFGLAVRSPPHNDSVVYLRKGDFRIEKSPEKSPTNTNLELSEQEKSANIVKESNLYSFDDWAPPFVSHTENIWKFNAKCAEKQPLGAVLDTGAQRGATGTVTEILNRTGTTLNMQPAVGNVKRMTGILMGTETVDQFGKPLILVVPDVSVYDPKMSDSLISAGRLMEAGYKVNFRIPLEAITDGFSSTKFPLYGGSITTPDNRTVIVMEYADHTWRLPKPKNPMKQSLFIQPKPSEELSSYAPISADVSTANKFSSLPEVFDSSDEAYVPKFLDAERVEGRMQQRFEVMCRNRQEAITLHRAHGHPSNRVLLLNLEAKGIPHKHLKRYILSVSCDACRAAIGKRDNKTSTVALTKRERIAQQKKTDKAQRKLCAQQKANLISVAYPENDLDTLEISPITDTVDPTSTITESLARFHEFTAPADEFDYSTFNSLAHSPPHTDLRMDWADACSLGRLPSLNRYFLLILDKGTEHWATYPSKTRGSGTPLELLKQYVVTTGRKPRYLRVDNAKEFISQDIVDYCRDNDIILQPVVAYNHTMQARVEGAIGCSKQHSRVALVCANKPTRFWPDATIDFTTKRNALWARRDEHGQLSTANDRMQPAFAGSYKTVAIPFGSRVTGYLPREHPLVKNGSFGDRFVEGTYLRADNETPCIRMYCIALKSELLVQDFKSYPEEFPFRDPSCLLRCTPAIMKDLALMHVDDAHDDKLVAEENALQVHTRAQTRAAEAAQVITASTPLTCDSDDQTKELIEIPVVTTDPPSTKYGSTRATHEISLHDDLANHTELAIARALLRHSVEFILPPHYKPDVVGEMRVIGVDTKKLTKTKAVLLVKFLTPQSLKDTVMQMYCTSLEPKRGLGQGADLSVLTAFKHTLPHAKSLYDIGVRILSPSEVTRAMLADFNSVKGGLVFDATQVDSLQNETSERNPLGEGFHLRSARDPLGYTRATPDPKHHGQAMRSPMRTEWIKSQGLEMQGLWSRGVFQKVLRTSLKPEDKVFSTRFHYKIKRKGGAFDKCKVRLVVQGQHMKRKGKDGVGDYDDAFSPVPAASGFRTILSLATQLDMFTDHVDISQAFVQGDLLPGDGHNGNVYISSPPGYEEDSRYVYRLLKPLYGMPSAARAWHTTMSAFLQREGCETVGFEKSMWRVVIDGHQILLGAHIDDFVIACANRQVLDAFRIRLLEEFEGTYEGPLEHYLGCEITRDIVAGITNLSQKHYAEEILRTYGFWDIPPRNTPMKPNTRLSKDDCDSDPKPDFHRRYRGIVGSLGYLVTMTRPDLAWSYSELSKYVQYPGKTHMDAAEHVLQYLRDTVEESITYTRGARNANELWGWVDADWAGDTDTRRSHTGYIIMMNGGPISWKSRRQDNVSLSTSEAEFVAASQAGQEVIYLRETLRDFGYQQTKPTEIYEDNLACVAMSENPVRRKFSRHIDIRRYFVRELVKAGYVKLIPLRTHKMVADALTKSLPSPAFIGHRRVMMGQTPFALKFLHS